MKLKYKFEYMEVGDEIMAVPVGERSNEFNGMLTLNDTAKEILELLQTIDTPEELHKRLSELHPDEDYNEIGNQLCDFLNRLLKEGLLEP